jgi:hypothetical protein
LLFHVWKFKSSITFFIPILFYWNFKLFQNFLGKLGKAKNMKNNPLILKNVCMWSAYVMIQLVDEWSEAFGKICRWVWKINHNLNKYYLKILLFSFHKTRFSSNFWFFLSKRVGWECLGWVLLEIVHCGCDLHRFRGNCFVV